jgi:ABC-type branched-subunit amino acid transport system substrate-binding protein
MDVAPAGLAGELLTNGPVTTMLQPCPHRTSNRRRPLLARALLLLLAVTATACAGDVVRYHNGAVGADGVTILATGGAPARQSAGLVPGAAPITAVTDTTTVTEGSFPANPLAAPSATTAASGPAARLNRPSAAGGPAPTGAPGRPGAGPAGIVASAAGPAGSGSATGGGSGGSGSGGTGGGGSVVAGPLPAAGGTTTGVTKDTITLGIFYPKTGPYTGLFRNSAAVAQAAADEAGVINGRRLVVKFYDDGTANASTIQVEEKRAKDEAFSYVSIVSESNVVLAPLADQHKIPVVVGNIDQKVAEGLTYAFPVYGYWTRMAMILPTFIRNVLNGGSKKIGIVYETTSTATDAKNAFKGKAKETGLNVVFEQPIAQNQSTCANEVSNLQAHGVELVYMMNGPLGAICMLRDAKALGYKPTWTGVGVSWAGNVTAAASGGGADGIRFLNTVTTLETPPGRHFSELLRKAAPNSGADSDDVMLIWYALVRSAIEGLRRAGPDLTRENLLQTWETRMTGYDSGYLPPPTFGPGNRSGPLAFSVTACCTDGQWTTPQPGWRATF